MEQPNAELLSVLLQFVFQLCLCVCLFVHMSIFVVVCMCVCLSMCLLVEQVHVFVTHLSLSESARNR